MSVHGMNPPITIEAALAAYKSADYLHAADLLKPLAEQGDSAAQYHLGLMHRHGRGLPQDDALAANWYRKAAEQGRAMCVGPFMPSRARRAPRRWRGRHLVSQSGRSRQCHRPVCPGPDVSLRQWRAARSWRRCKLVSQGCRPRPCHGHGISRVDVLSRPRRAQESCASLYVVDVGLAHRVNSGHARHENLRHAGQGNDGNANQRSAQIGVRLGSENNNGRGLGRYPPPTPARSPRRG
ncbi:MAG: sel1 repeat family protein [Rhodospirillaceae bacterium]|nr:sel1 repeat family protein [Rhodospirillaceae bacterium]